MKGNRACLACLKDNERGRQEQLQQVSDERRRWSGKLADLVQQAKSCGRPVALEALAAEMLAKLRELAQAGYHPEEFDL